MTAQIGGSGRFSRHEREGTHQHKCQHEDELGACGYGTEGSEQALHHCDQQRKERDRHQRGAVTGGVFNKGQDVYVAFKLFKSTRTHQFAVIVLRLCRTKERGVSTEVDRLCSSWKVDGRPSCCQE